MPSVERVAVITHGRDNVDEALGAWLGSPRGSASRSSTDDDADIAVVLGGDGTMLGALKRFLGKPVPVIGVNYGRVGFLTAMRAAGLEAGLERVFAGEYALSSSRH